MKLKTKKIEVNIYYAENLKEFLAFKKVTAKSVAQICKVSTAYVSDISKGRRPLPERIKKYLESL